MSLVLPVEQRLHTVSVCVCVCVYTRAHAAFLLDPHTPIRRAHSGLIVQCLARVASTLHLGAPERLGAGRRSAGRKGIWRLRPGCVLATRHHD